MGVTPGKRRGLLFLLFFRNSSACEPWFSAKILTLGSARPGKTAMRSLFSRCYSLFLCSEFNALCPG